MAVVTARNPFAWREISTLVALAGAMLGMGSVTAGSAVPAVSDRQIVIVTPGLDDDRVSTTRRAIAFWNTTLARLGVHPRLVETRLLVEPPATRTLENYARQIWQQAGRLTPGVAGPRAPSELAELGSDIVVLLSKQDIMSFAWPLPDTPRFFVAIQAGTRQTADDSPLSHNVIAHELGHALGLPHNDDPTSLMCGPCRSGVTDDVVVEPFLPLTGSDRDRLRALYAAG